MFIQYIKPSTNFSQFKFQNKYKNQPGRASLVVRWLRICLPMQGTQVQALVRENPTCHGANKSMHHDYRACKPQLLSPCATPTEARAPRARALQQEKPPQ